MSEYRSRPGVVLAHSQNLGALDGMRGVHPRCCHRDTEVSTDPIDLVAVVSTWNDGDIIGATVRNCFAQGCSRVMLLDNASQDDSKAEAVAAGAEIGEVYHTEFYDDDLRIRKQNLLAKRMVEESSFRTCWVLSLDADEFLHGDNGETVIETLRQIRNEPRIVGSYCVDLCPDSRDGYLPNTHPALVMSKGIFRRTGSCPKWHWKHAAIKYTDKRFDMSQTRGNHFPAAPYRDRNSTEECAIHLPMLHAPFRNYERSLWRLRLLCEGQERRSKFDDDVTGNAGAIRRLQMIELMYSKRYSEIEMTHNHFYNRKIIGAVPYPWKTYWPDLMLQEFR